MGNLSAVKVWTLLTFISLAHSTGYVSAGLTQLTGESETEPPKIESALAYVRFKDEFLTTACVFDKKKALALAKSLYDFIPNGYGLIRVVIGGNPAKKSGEPYEVESIDAEPKPKPEDIKMYPQLIDRVIAVIKLKREIEEDVKINGLNYAELLEDEILVFKNLKTVGWDKDHNLKVDQHVEARSNENYISTNFKQNSESIDEKYLGAFIVLKEKIFGIAVEIKKCYYYVGQREFYYKVFFVSINEKGAFIIASQYDNFEIGQKFVRVSPSPPKSTRKSFFSCLSPGASTSRD